MSRYLVAGCAGFIGAQVCSLLMESGHAVQGLDNLNDSYDPRLKEWRLQRLQANAEFQFFPLDICDRHSLTILESVHRAAPFDGILNLAARAGVRQSLEDPWRYLDTNVVGTLNLLEFGRANAVPKFVLASSSSLYGKGTHLPWSEEAETDRPLSPYAASKKAAEALCHSYHHLYGLDVTVLRYFTVYGPAGRPDMSPFRFIQWISEGREVEVFGDGNQARDFTFVEDIARGTVAGLRSVGYEIVNLGSDQPVALREFICRIEELTGCRARIVRRPVHAADVPATWADIRKAERLLGWRPRTELSDGLKLSILWYEQNRDWVRNIVG